MTLLDIPWNYQISFPILTALQILPLLAIVILYPLQKNKHRYCVALLFALLEIVLALVLIGHFDTETTKLQFVERSEWLSYHAGVDGISILFVLMSAVLSFLVILYGKIIPLEKSGRFILVTLAVEATMMASFLTVNLFWFVLVSTVQMGLLAYMVWRWATSPERDIALARYLQFMGIGIILLLLGSLVLSWNYYSHTGEWSSDLTKLLQIPIDLYIQSIVFFLLFFGFIVRLPLFPFHGWFSVVAEHGVVAIAPVLIIGLKTGVYGMLRFIFPLVPDAVVEWQYFAVAFAVVGIFYAAILALLQTNLRRLLAYAVVSHTGVLVLGLFSLNHLSFQGGLMLSMSFGLAMSGLFFMTGLVYWRTRTMVLSRLGGLFDHIPVIGIAFLVAGLSIVGMPGTPGFDSVHLMMEATIERFGAIVTVAAAVGNVIAAGFLLMSFQKAFLSPAPEGSTADISPTSSLELILSVIMIALLLIAGFYSEPWLALIETSVEHLGSVYVSHN